MAAVLACAWGCSFLFIKIGVSYTSALSLVAGRSTTVTYVFPVVGVLLGTIFLEEALNG